ALPGVKIRFSVLPTTQPPIATRGYGMFCSRATCICIVLGLQDIVRDHRIGTRLGTSKGRQVMRNRRSFRGSRSCKLFCVPRLLVLESRVVPYSTITTPYYQIPNFGDNPTVSATSSGAWSNPAIWSTGQVPQAGSVVSIGAGDVVTY